MSLMPAACKQVQLWRLPKLSAAPGNSSELIGAVTALGSTQPWHGQAVGSLAWVKATGTEATQLLVVGDASNSRLALYAIGGDTADMQQLQVKKQIASDLACDKVLTGHDDVAH
jgi:hypothetical protein